MQVLVIRRGYVPENRAGTPVNLQVKYPPPGGDQPEVIHFKMGSALKTSNGQNAFVFLGVKS